MISNREVGAGATVHANVAPIYFPQYVVAIGGTQLLVISAAKAKRVFRRWSEQPDVLVRGDLLAGFFWQWPDQRRTRVMVTPLDVEAAVPAQTGRRTGVEGVGIATAVSVATGETPIRARASQRADRSRKRESAFCGQLVPRRWNDAGGELAGSTRKFLVDGATTPRPRTASAQHEEVPTAMYFTDVGKIHGEHP